MIGQTKFWCTCQRPTMRSSKVLTKGGKTQSNTPGTASLSNRASRIVLPVVYFMNYDEVQAATNNGFSFLNLHEPIHAEGTWMISHEVYSALGTTHAIAEAQCNHCKIHTLEHYFDFIATESVTCVRNVNLPPDEQATRVESPSNDL